MPADLVPLPTTVHGAVSSSLEPVLWIEPAQRVTVRTVDVGFGVECPLDAVSPRAKVLPQRPELANGPGCVGPIGVRGAEPGMVLAVTLHRIEPGAWGFTYLGGGNPGWIAEHLGLEGEPPGVVTWTIDHAAATATSDLGWSVPIAPFLGTIGVAPASTDLVAGWAPRPTGGNLDCRELVAGTTIYFPVEASGALLSLGDGHAAQAHGEVAGMAIECMMEAVEFTVELLDAPPWGRPGHVSADSPDGTITFGFGEHLDDAMSGAVQRMVECIGNRFQVTPGEALVLASAAADFHVTQVVNGIRGVHGVLGHGALT